MGKVFVEIDEDIGNRIYRLTFKCNVSDYSTIIDEVISYGEILKEEIEVEE